MQADMVCATLDDSKTQTRRLQGLDQVNQSPDDWDLVGITIEPKKKDLASTARFRHKHESREEIVIACPYGKPKDLLWIRETWRPRSWGEDFDWMMIEYRATQDLLQSGQPGMTKQIDPGDAWDGFTIEYAWTALIEECEKAGCLLESGVFRLEGANGKFPIKWRPSIFMFRVMSRLSIEIADIHIERMQSISKEDAISEGVPPFDWNDGKSLRPIQAYKRLWDSINKKTHPWDSNPFVWVLKFKRVLS